MTKTEPRERIHAKRQHRIEKEYEAMARGIWSNADIAHYVGCSPATVKRDLTNHYALEYPRKLMERRLVLADQLVKRQIEQIESGDLAAHIMLLYRSRIIEKLLPSRVVQKIEGEVVTYDVDDLLDRMIKLKDKEDADEDEEDG